MKDRKENGFASACLRNRAFITEYSFFAAAVGAYTLLEKRFTGILGHADRAVVSRL